MSTAILSETYRISSELRSQATAGLVSTTVGDHVGIRGAVGSFFWRIFRSYKFTYKFTYKKVLVFLARLQVPNDAVNVCKRCKRRLQTKRGTLRLGPQTFGAT